MSDEPGTGPNTDEEDEIRAEIDAARSGDVAAAQFLLVRFTKAVRTDTYPKVLMEYFADAFAGIALGGAPAENSLHLKRSKGKPPKDGPFDVVHQVNLALSVAAGRASGLTHQEAVLRTSESPPPSSDWESLPHSKRSVERAFAKCRKLARQRLSPPATAEGFEHRTLLNTLVGMEDEPSNDEEFPEPTDYRPVTPLEAASLVRSRLVTERDLFNLIWKHGAFDGFEDYFLK